jgi:hypothetical protein
VCQYMIRSFDRDTTDVVSPSSGFVVIMWTYGRGAFCHRSWFLRTMVIRNQYGGSSIRITIMSSYELC